MVKLWQNNIQQELSAVRSFAEEIMINDIAIQITLLDHQATTMKEIDATFTIIHNCQTF